MKSTEVGGRIPREADAASTPTAIAAPPCEKTGWSRPMTIPSAVSWAAYSMNYFLSQFWFEKTGNGPLVKGRTKRPGSKRPMQNALGIPNKRKSLLYHLRLLSQDWPKGHWPCPCGSGRRLRHCHHDEAMAIHQRVPPDVARRMLRRLNPNGGEMRGVGFLEQRAQDFLGNVFPFGRAFSSRPTPLREDPATPPKRVARGQAPASG